MNKIKKKEEKSASSSPADQNEGKVCANEWVACGDTCSFLLHDFVNIYFLFSPLLKLVIINGIYIMITGMYSGDLDREAECSC